MAKTLLNMRMSLIAGLLLIALNGCDSGPSKAISEFLDQASNKVGQVAPDPSKVRDLTQEELSKLFTFEYKVVEFDQSLNPEEIESKLADLGKEMWECFSVTAIDSKLKIFCKRRPKTYLRYIPRWF